ncbi:efflux RND transporter periplasmic adaptor subunit [Hydrotalea sp.]|uniref:efflux RND transporter periplasmic adaptor subunit n=1 Tax=Hydrotalea sp. TaxID=2881279 RepID=UPI0025891DE5|nr:efflux RND transporter periplasmic adaptor subunit [Hydrotalea sp.]
MNKNVKTTTVMLVMTGLFFSACSSNEKKQENTTAILPVEVKMALPNAATQNALSLGGQIEAVQSANISTRVMGYITSMKVKVGDHVTQGQLLATISNQDMLAKRAQADAMIAEAEAALKNAQKDYDRFTALYQQQSASAKELDNVTLQYNAAKSRVDAARQMRNEVNAMLAYTSLIAPFSGVVTQKMADAGSMANPGMPLLTIEKSGSFQVSIAVPESQINNMHMGNVVPLYIQAINKTIKGSITQLSQSAQYTGGQYIVKVAIPENEKTGLYAGMYVTAQLPVKQTTNVLNTSNDAVMVPVSAIFYKDELTGLYTVSANHTALLRWVRLGKQMGNDVEVLSGLSKDEPFILSANGKLADGVPVKEIK